jgi:hypothetical protein
VIDFIIVLGNSLDVGVPSDNTVTNAKIVDSTIALGKLSATGTKDATTFLRGDNTFDTPPLGGITEADQWRITADHTGVADITANWERVDTDGFNYIGTGMSESSGIFTFPSTGIYLISFNATIFTSGGASAYVLSRILTTLDGTTYGTSASSSYSSTSGDGVYQSTSLDFIFDVTNTSTHKCKFKCAQNNANTINYVGSTNENYTCATFIRLGDT